MSIYSSDPTQVTYPDVTRGWWAEARSHPDFLCVMTQSGYRGGQYIDDKGRELHLAPKATDEVLGEAVLDALSSSRWLLSKPKLGEIYYPDVQFDEEVAGYRNAALREAAWEKHVRKLYKLKYKKDLYVPMKRCEISRKDGKIIISCRVHYPESQQGDCWGFDTNENAPFVILPDTASTNEIGAGLRLAFSRCHDLPG